MSNHPTDPQTNTDDRITTARPSQPQDTSSSPQAPTPVEAAVPSHSSADEPLSRGPQETPEPQQQPGASASRDQRDALESLDVTTTRMMPQPLPLWEDAQVKEPEPTQPAQPRRLATAALVCVVAVVSFVAGGITARLASQMPLIFPQKQDVAPSTASLEQEPEEAPQSTPVQEETSQAPEDKTYTQTPTLPDDDSSQQDTYTTPEQDDTDSLPTHRWDFDSEGDRSLTYDNDDNRVTIDYDGYLFSFDVDDLMGQETQNDTSQDTGDEWSYTAPPSSNTRTYGYGTGYDTEDDRDLYGWTRIF